ncbi:BatA domain-containing protein [Dyadobacter sp. 676]|uniref:BatA domain-containing protein n=1 Tax=Dyadobacter sp. 676 TaxID=3088362 RepID=A0AAU8FH05_9BACT
MTFLQPYMLWGILAVAIPVAIHFWHQKRGRTIEWAAMRWLGDPTTLRHRGLRLNEVWLMVLRCFLVALLALIISKPVLEWFKNAGGLETIHLVQPDRLVTGTYRFELENAWRAGEKVYWLGAAPEKATGISPMQAVPAPLTYLQQNINALAGGSGKNFKLYFSNDPALADFPKIYIPGEYQLFPVADSSGKKRVSLLENNPARKKAIRVLLENGDAGERRTIEAALVALAGVYGFLFETEYKNNPARHYDWVFTNKPVTHAGAGTKYVVSGAAPKWDAPATVIFLPDSLTLADSRFVESGRFPEWLGELLVRDLNLQPDVGRLSNSQLYALFEKVPSLNAGSEAALRPWLLLLFLGLLIAERLLALRKPSRSHG